jgi:hypothetical protein
MVHCHSSSSLLKFATNFLQNQSFQIRALCSAASGSLDRVPILGELPVSSGPNFWLQRDQSFVPLQYRHEEFPSHYQDLPVIFASFREETNVPLGSRAARRLRALNWTPGLLDSLPRKQAPLHLVMPTAQIHAVHRACGQSFQNRMCLLNIIPLEELSILNEHKDDVQNMVEKGWNPTVWHSFQVLPRRVHFNILAELLLSVTFMNCSSTRIVNSMVPIMPVNEDESPSAKRGGYAIVTKKMVKVRSLATNIPLTIEVDCSALDTGDKLHLRDLELCEGQYFVKEDPGTCILKMETGK